MGEIKSAFEIAMEKAAKIGQPSKEETLKWKYVPEGQRLAAEYFREEASLVAELGKYDQEARRFVALGAEEVLLGNIGLPVNDLGERNNKRAMEAIKAIKGDKGAIENVYSRMRRVFEHYEQQGEQQRREAYEALKQHFHARLQQAVRQQGGLPAGARIDVESQPQFQEEWRRTLAQLDSQYVKLLEECKQEISSIR